KVEFGPPPANSASIHRPDGKSSKSSHQMAWGGTPIGSIVSMSKGPLTPDPISRGKGKMREKHGGGAETGRQNRTKGDEPRTNRLENSHPEQLASLLLPRRGVAVFAGGDAGERGEMTPAEGGTGEVEIVPHRLEILLGVEGAVLA